MEQHTLFYQPQYQPSFMADQQKIDDWLSNDTLNTPDINPDFFLESNIFKNEKVDIKPKDLIDEFSFINPDLTLSGNYTSDRSDTYSPTYSDKKLESSAININSPEMMPVSPNKVCPQMDATFYEDEVNNYGHVEYGFEQYSSPSGSSCNSSRHNSISAGSDTQNIVTDYLFTPNNNMNDNSNVLCRIQPNSPASYSSETYSENKTITNLDNVVVVKQEPTDQYPTIIDEWVNPQPFGLSQPQSMSSYATLDTTDIASTNQYYTYAAPLPTTVNPIIMQQQPVAAQTSSGQSSPAGRKRNANAAFTTSASGSTKKPRMTKREKQKMMESDISKYENENKDLRTSIDLLERQIQFCKRFLSENVAPVIQRQQQQQQMHQFGSPQHMVLVESL